MEIKVCDEQRPGIEILEFHGGPGYEEERLILENGLSNGLRFLMGPIYECDPVEFSPADRPRPAGGRTALTERADDANGRGLSQSVHGEYGGILRRKPSEMPFRKGDPAVSMSGFDGAWHRSLRVAVDPNAVATERWPGAKWSSFGFGPSSGSPASSRRWPRLPYRSVERGIRRFRDVHRCRPASLAGVWAVWRMNPTARGANHSLIKSLGGRCTHV